MTVQPRHRLPALRAAVPARPFPRSSAGRDASQGETARRGAEPQESDAEPDQRQSSYPDAPKDLRWSCTLTGRSWETQAHGEQLRDQLQQAGLPVTSFPRLAFVLDDLLARLAAAGTTVERVTVECRSEVLVLRIDDPAPQLAALPQLDAPFLEVLTLDHGQFCQSGRRCTWATLPRSAR